MVYKCPGPHQCYGGTYDYRQVIDEDALTESMKEGWFPTLPCAQDPENFDLEEYLTAIDIAEKDMLDAPTIEAEDIAVTREQLESQAKKLGVGFSGKTRTSVLEDKIRKANMGR